MCIRDRLNRIVVDGTTTTPDFRLDIAKRPLALNTTFHAIVDGTNGDTYLQPVDAWLQHTHIVARGEVVHTAGVPGRDIRLDVTVDPGLIEDILLLSVKAAPPLMTGQMQMHTKFDLPPGPAAVTDRLRLDGAFALTGAHFTSENIISKIDELSLRSQGKAAQANQEDADRKKTVAQNASAQNGSPQNGPAQNGAPQTITTPQTSPQPSSPANPPPATSSAADIAADMRGTFTFGSGRLAIPALDFRVPGADIAVQGAYTLQGLSLIHI